MSEIPMYPDENDGPVCDVCGEPESDRVWSEVEVCRTCYAGAQYAIERLTAERDDTFTRALMLSASLAQAEAERDEAREDRARMAGELSRCSHALGVEQWAEMPPAIVNLRAELATLREVVAAKVDK